MFKDLLLEAFLERNRIDSETWKKANYRLAYASSNRC